MFTDGKLPKKKQDKPPSPPQQQPQLQQKQAKAPSSPRLSYHSVHATVDGGKMILATVDGGQNMQVNSPSMQSMPRPIQQQTQMFEAGESLDKITDIEWPEAWVLKQRQLTGGMEPAGGGVVAARGRRRMRAGQAPLHCRRL